MDSGRVAGVDGCRDRWLAAVLAGRQVRWLLLPDAAAVCALDVAAVAVDVPIGLPRGARRRCDRQASQLLRPDGSSRVFPTPPRVVLQAQDYRQACELSFADCGRRLSRQTWGIWPKVRDFDGAPRDDARLVEAHPEVSFREMTGRVLTTKHSEQGLAERRAALAEHLDADVAEALRTVPPGAGRDDALDALACAWTAQRWRDGVAGALGDGERDETGVPMRIVF